MRKTDGNDVMHDAIESLCGRTVAVGVSGGVDSLYSALRLKDAGADVLPLHALFLPEALRSEGLEPMLDRLRAALERFGMRLRVVDLSHAFQRHVIQPFMQAYIDGLTPNPCALCNRSMKFGLLWNAAASLGASRMVTGHYARLLHLGDGPALFAGVDPVKDQSYFLALTPLEQLSYAFFPLGSKKKSEIVADMAQRRIAVPQAQESQEICFIPHNDYRAFLREYAPRWLADASLPGEGDVVLPDGTVIARHRGLWNYTEGQRKGLGIAWREPLFVLEKDVEGNRLVVGGAGSHAGRRCRVEGVNFLLPIDRWPAGLLAKTRYRQRLAPVRISRVRDEDHDGTLDKDTLLLDFYQDERGVSAAPGQVAAVYAEYPQGLRLLAGGVVAAHGRFDEGLE